MSRNKVIEMQGVYKYFGSFCANENVDFNVYPLSRTIRVFAIPIKQVLMIY